MKFKCSKGEEYNKNYRGFIYKTTNLDNGKWYIGMHHQIDDPNDIYDENYLGSGKLISYAINKAIKELGSQWRVRFKRDILDPGPYTWEETAELENKLILETNAINDPMSYNLIQNANPPINNRYNTVVINDGKHHKHVSKSDLDVYLQDGWVLGMTKEVCDLISTRNKGKPHLSRRGVSLSEDHKQNLSKSLKGKSKPIEVREKISKSLKQYSNLPETKYRRSLAISGENNPSKRIDVKEKLRKPRPNTSGEFNHFYGKKHTEESLAVISYKAKERFSDKTKHPMYGKKHNEESKKKNSISVKSAIYHTKCRKCGEMFESLGPGYRYCSKCRGIL